MFYIRHFEIVNVYDNQNGQVQYLSFTDRIILNIF